MWEIIKEPPRRRRKQFSSLLKRFVIVAATRRATVRMNNDNCQSKWPADDDKGAAHKAGQRIAGRIRDTRRRQL